MNGVVKDSAKNKVMMGKDRNAHEGGRSCPILFFIEFSL
jgi:hypothetical protein